jgi:putative transposase
METDMRVRELKNDEAAAGEPTASQRRRREPRRIPNEVLDMLLTTLGSPTELTGSNGLLRELSGALISRALESEMTQHLGFEHGDAPSADQGNRRNGHGTKTVRTKVGAVEVTTPRDREGTFEPKLVPKRQRHFDGFDDQILPMYARGMSVRDIAATLEDIYGVEVSPEFISNVTESIVDELRGWQQRPLERVYPIVYLDAMFVKVRTKGAVRNIAIYNAIGVRLDGTKSVLGMWHQETEGAKFWMSILEELRQRGVEDILILCADGLSGMPDAVAAIFPKTVFQTCIVHMIRASTRYVPWKDRRAVCADLRQIYTAIDEVAALEALQRFDTRWGTRFPMITKSWETRWDEISPFLAFPAEIRRAIYTTNAVEALHRQLRKVVKTRGHLPSPEAAIKLLYLATREVKKKWGNASPTWSLAILQFAIHFEGRLPTT